MVLGKELPDLPEFDLSSKSSLCSAMATDAKNMTIQPCLQRENLTYTACYCEENVWKLCEAIGKNMGEERLRDYTVCFISNAQQMTPIWCQKSSEVEDNLVVWDYHVVLIQERDGEEAYIYDLDTTLPCPCPLREYVQGAFKPHLLLKKEYRRSFRLVPARDYLSMFASDRSHMIDENGEYKSEPPPYPPIRTSECTMNLAQFTSMTPLTGPGRVVDLKALMKIFA
eukprot:comp6220_c0_seq1/m.2048 comp6220_c0_seq1/g.2048  ORF comp6220_c0_seq1/g.2048 comp6220_c0_seq1/m.2048 type:complete len:226 (-) comp6220_c0_seq1:50-727(-)